MYFKDNVYELKDTFMINLYKIFVGGLSVFIVVSFTAQIYAEMEEEKWHSLDLLEWEIWDMRC